MFFFSLLSWLSRDCPFFIIPLLLYLIYEPVKLVCALCVSPKQQRHRHIDHYYNDNDDVFILHSIFISFPYWLFAYVTYTYNSKTNCYFLSHSLVFVLILCPIECGGKTQTHNTNEEQTRNDSLLYCRCHRHRFVMMCVRTCLGSSVLFNSLTNGIQLIFFSFFPTWLALTPLQMNAYQPELNLISMHGKSMTTESQNRLRGHKREQLLQLTSKRGKIWIYIYVDLPGNFR